MNEEVAAELRTKTSAANLSVVISNLPESTSLKQISKFCSNVGVLAQHPETGEDLILYSERNHKATVTYSYPDGANAAIKILNNTAFTEGYIVAVERAKREPFDFSVWKSAMRQQRKFHSYMGDHSEELDAKEIKRLKCMVIKHAFTPQEMIKNPTLYGQLVNDFTSICSKFGKVTLVKPFETHPEGIVLVRFDDPKSSSIAIGELDSAKFGDHVLTVEPWDGKDLAVRENKEDELRRLRKFESELDGKENEYSD